MNTIKKCTKRKDVTSKKTIISPASQGSRCPMCGEMAYGWVYMLHFTLGCETAKRY